MKKIVSALLLSIAAIAIVGAWAQSKSVTVMTDSELKAAIDSIAKLEQPLTAAPLIAEAKKRATENHDTKWMFDIIKTDVDLNVRRLTRETSAKELLSAYRDEAWEPLRQALSAECYSVGHDAQDARAALANPEELRKYKASDVYDKAGDINLLDYLATSLAISAQYDVREISEQSQVDAFNAPSEIFAASTDSLPFPADAARIMMREGIKAHDAQSVAIAQSLRVVLAAHSAPLRQDSLISELQGMKADGSIASALVSLAKASTLLTDLSGIDIEADNKKIDKAAKLLRQVKGDVKGLEDDLSKSIGQCAADGIKEICDTSICITSSRQVMPRQYTPLILSYRNIDKVTLRVYRVASSCEQRNSNIKMSKAVSPANLVMTKEVDLPMTKSRVFHSLAYTELDGLGTGHYVLSASTSKGKELAVTSFFCSSIAPQLISAGADSYLQISDFETGAPRADVKVSGSQPGKDGWMAWKSKSENLVITSDGDNYAANAYANAWRVRSVASGEKKAQLVSDRRIYRPGQSILFKVYFYNSFTDRVEPFKFGRDCTVRLYGSNGKELAKASLKLDEFGAADGRIAIPDDVMKGMCHFLVECGPVAQNFYVQVEDFKRTDNSVAISPFDDVVLPGAEAVVKGVCNSAAGLPVSNAKVVYELRKTGSNLRTGETLTGDDGSFSFSFKTEEGLYDIDVRVTDEKGETAQDSRSLQVSPRGYDVEMSLKESQATIGRGPRLTLISNNYNGRPYKSQVRLKVTPYEPIEKLRPDMGEEVDTVIGGRCSVIFGDATYEKNGARLAPAPIYDKLYDIEGGQDIDLSELNMPARRYKIEATAEALDSSTISVSQEFVALADKGRMDGLSYLTLDAPETVKAGETLTFRVGSGLDDAFVTVLISKASTIVLRKQVKLSRAIEKLEYLVPADCVNGETLKLAAFVQKEGRKYTKSLTVRVEKPEPQLTLKLTSFRDHSQPGAREKWTVQCLSPSGRTVAASMYDSRLDKYVDNTWKASFDRLTVDNRLMFGNVHARTYNVYDDEGGVSNYFYHNTNCAVSGRLLNDVFGSLGYAAGEHYEPMHYGSVRGVMFAAAGSARMSNKMVMMEAATEEAETLNECVVTSDSAAPEAAEPEHEAGERGDIEPMRENFDETVFFLPSLTPDTAGNATFEFTLPDNLTAYNFRALAVDKQMRYAAIAQTLTVAKAMNVQIGLPRFATEGDSLFIPVSVASTDSVATSAQVSITISDKETGRVLLAAKDLEVAFDGVKSVRVGSDFVVPEGVDTLVVEAVGTASTGNKDGERRLLPVQKRNLEVEESISFVLTGKGMHKIVNPFTDGKTKTLTFNYTSNAFIEVLRALPVLDKSYYPCTDTYLGRYESASIAVLLKSRPDIKKAVEYLKANEGKLPTVGDADHNTWYLVAKRLANHDKEVVELLSGSYAQKVKSTSLRKLSNMQRSDGSFPWFSGMDGSDFMTVAVVSTLGEMNMLGLIQTEDMPAVNKMISKAKPYVNSLLKKELAAYEEETKRDKSVRRRYAAGFSSFALEALQARVLMGDYAADKTVRKMVDILKDNWQYPVMCDRVAALFTLAHVGETSSAQTVLKSLEENLVQTKDGTAYIPEDGIFHRRQQVEAQAMLVIALQRLAPGSPNALKVVNHLMLMKRGEAWPDAKSTSRAVLALLASSATSESEDAVEVGDFTTTCTVSKPEVSVALAADSAVKKAEIKKGGDVASWGSWHRVMRSPIDELKADGDDKLKITRSLEVRRVVNGAAEWQPVGPTESLSVGDQVRVTLRFYNDEPLSFVRVRDFRTAAAEPDDKLSGYRGWWFWRLADADVPTPCHYMSIADDKTEFFIDYLYEGWHSVSYTATVTHKGDFAGGYADAQCMYATELMAHTDGRRVSVAQ